MMYHYITLADETVITHSYIFFENRLKKIEVYFERATDLGFDVARCKMPDKKRWVF